MIVLRLSTVKAFVLTVSVGHTGSPAAAGRPTDAVGSSSRLFAVLVSASAPTITVTLRIVPGWIGRT